MKAQRIIVLSVVSIALVAVAALVVGNALDPLSSFPVGSVPRLPRGLRKSLEWWPCLIPVLLLVGGLFARRKKFDTLANTCYAFLWLIIIGTPLGLGCGGVMSCINQQRQASRAQTLQKEAENRTSGTELLSPQWKRVKPPKGFKLKYSASVPTAQLRMVLFDGTTGPALDFAPYQYPSEFDLPHENRARFGSV